MAMIMRCVIRCRIRFWAMGRISTDGVSVRIYTRRRVLVMSCTLQGTEQTMMDSKLLEFGGPNTEGNNLDNKYGKRR